MSETQINSDETLVSRGRVIFEGHGPLAGALQREGAQSVIENRSVALSTTIEDLNQTVNEFLRKINPVLTPGPESTDDKPMSADKRAEGSGVAEYLFHQNEDLCGVLERLRYALYRVEL